MDAARIRARMASPRVRRWVYHPLLNDHDRQAMDVELDAQFGAGWTDRMWEGSVADILMLWGQRERLARAEVNRRVAANAALPRASQPITPAKPQTRRTFSG